MLLDAGAPKDLSNRLGWTALHEACFYNRMETVKMLLLSGANPTLRSRQGALPYHLACIPEIRNMLESMGGEGAGGLGRRYQWLRLISVFDLRQLL